MLSERRKKEKDKYCIRLFAESRKAKLISIEVYIWRILKDKKVFVLSLKNDGY